MVHAWEIALTRVMMFFHAWGKTLRDQVLCLSEHAAHYEKGGGFVRNFIMTIIAFALVFGTAITVAGAGDKGLLSQVYPGVVEDKNNGDATVHVFLSRDPLAKVQAWYGTKKGGLTQNAGIELANADGALSRDIAPIGAIVPGVKAVAVGQQIMDSTKVAWCLKDITLAKAVGVLLQSLELDSSDGGDFQPGVSGQIDSSTAAQLGIEKLRQHAAAVNDQMTKSLSPEDRTIGRMSYLFDGFKQGYYHGGGRHSKQDLVNLYKKYSYLERSYFPTMKMSDGKLTSYDAWLMDKYKSRFGKEMKKAGAPAMANHQDLAEIGRRMQEAAQAGRMDELQALQQQMLSVMHGGQKASRNVEKAVNQDHWDDWLAFLNDLDDHAYRTRIWINTEPKSWGF